MSLPFSIQSLGGVVVHVNPNYQPAELEHILQKSESKGIVAFIMAWNRIF
ncbi:long-subunit acyl-CoA synthetase (AMP-forming) [Cytobacillus horneckiae]|nr:AMP-binding protein [Cytobacillus horneckiae]